MQLSPTTARPKPKKAVCRIQQFQDIHETSLEPPLSSHQPSSWTFSVLLPPPSSSELRLSRWPIQLRHLSSSILSLADNNILMFLTSRNKLILQIRRVAHQAYCEIVGVGDIWFSVDHDWEDVECPEHAESIKRQFSVIRFQFKLVDGMGWRHEGWHTAQWRCIAIVEQRAYRDTFFDRIQNSRICSWGVSNRLFLEIFLGWNCHHQGRWRDLSRFLWCRDSVSRRTWRLLVGKERLTRHWHI